jgi:leucyl/phenylalanyl-tRNA--protein transferase
VRIDPPASVWEFPPVAVAGASDVVAAGADLEPGTVLAAYKRGLFPMPDSHGPLLWWSPVDRGVIEIEGFTPSRSLRRARQRFEIRVNTAFDQVIRACADPSRPGSWIDDDIIASYTRLHEMGWVHSVEAWDGDELAGGLYGVAIGGLFAGESMFHHKTDGSKAAVAGLVELLSDKYAAHRLLDIQWVTSHLATIGAVAIPRDAYVERLQRAICYPLPDAFS